MNSALRYSDCLWAGYHLILSAHNAEPIYVTDSHLEFRLIHPRSGTLQQMRMECEEPIGPSLGNESRLSVSGPDGSR